MGQLSFDIMKRIIIGLFLIAMSGNLLLTSCSKRSIAIDQAALDSRLQTYKTFIVTNNNDTIRGEKWDIKQANRGRWDIVIDGKKYRDNSIAAFQSQFGLAIRFIPAESAHSFVDQWAYYLKRGKVDVFSNHQYFTESYGLLLYYKKGEGDYFHKLTAKSLQELVSDNNEAMILYNASKIRDSDKDFVQKVLKVMDIYNGLK